MRVSARTPTYYLHLPGTFSLASTPLAGLNQLQIPVYTSPVPQHPLDITKESAIPFIPGGGLTRRILSSIPSSWSIPTASLLQFVIEGDNRADAQMLATIVVKVLGVDTLIGVWKQPGSWQHGLFGPPHDQTLYG
jgi:proteasome assembly chaperone 2